MVIALQLNVCLNKRLMHNWFGVQYARGELRLRPIMKIYLESDYL